MRSSLKSIRPWRSATAAVAACALLSAQSTYLLAATLSPVAGNEVHRHVRTPPRIPSAPAEIKAAIDSLRGKIAQRQLPEGALRARQERTMKRLALASSAIAGLLAATPPRPSSRVPASVESPDGATTAGRTECEDEEGFAPCATQQDRDDHEQLADELDAEATLVEQEMEAAEWEVVAYCNNNPYACGGGSIDTETESASLEDIVDGDGAAVPVCVPETPCWDLIGLTRDAINYVARPAVGSLWNTAKNVAGVTLRKLGWRAAAAITGFGTAALVGAYALECLVTELLSPDASISADCTLPSATEFLWREESSQGAP